MKSIISLRSLFYPQRAKELYLRFIAPRQQTQEARNREIVLTLLTIGTMVALGFLLLLLLVTLGVTQQTYLFGRILLCAVFLGLTIYIYILARRQAYRPAAIMLLSLYALTVAGMTWSWGVHLSFTLVFWALVIVLAGILLSARYALLAAAAVISTILLLLIMQMLGWYHPDESWLQSPPTAVDALAYCVLFMGLGMVSWLFGRQSERSLRRATQAEAELLKEQSLLEDKIEERTLELQVAQFEEMQQLYRFAELGHLSVALLHDLANHLTVLTLNIEDLDHKHHSDSIKRARHSIRYLENMVSRVRHQLHGREQLSNFSLPAKAREVMKLLEPKAREMQVIINCQTKGPKNRLRLMGDTVKFSQIMAIIITNAIEAYVDQPIKSQRTVDIVFEAKPDHIAITITNYGKPITSALRKTLFEPFRTTKKRGMGIGLYIARRMLENNFAGTITLAPTTTYTQFKLTLPHEP